MNKVKKASRTVLATSRVRGGVAVKSGTRAGGYDPVKRKEIVGKAN